MLANILIYVLTNSFWPLCGELVQSFTVLAHLENGGGKVQGGPHSEAGGAREPWAIRLPRLLGSSFLPKGSIVFLCQITSRRLPDLSQLSSGFVVGFCVGPVQGGGLSLQAQVSFHVAHITFAR